MRRDTTVPVVIGDLRALLFWATIGVRRAVAGSYSNIAETEGDPGIINSYAEHIRFALPFTPRFRTTMPKKRKR